MSNSQDLSSELAKARQQLQNAQTRIAELEAQLSKDAVGRITNLSEAKARVEAILNNSPDSILLIQSDLTIQQANFSFNRLFRCETDDYFGQSLVRLIHAEDVQSVTTLVQVVIAEHHEMRVEIRAVRKDGTVFEAELSLGLIRKSNGLVCTLRDITERKAQERQLQYHASLQQNVSDAVIVTDTEFRIQSWNKAAERIYGWRAEEIVGKVTAEILGTEYQSDTDHAHAAQFLREQGWWQGEVIQHHRDGSIRHILGSVTLVKDSRGLPIGVVAVNHDISERMTAQKQAEEVMRQALAKEKELGELKSRFVLMASHEFRTPLATILALTETLSAYHLRLPDDQIEEKLDEIKGQVSHLKDIMEDVLMLARMQARRFEFNPIKLDLEALCRSVLAEFRNHADTHLRLDYTRGDGVYEVVLDPKLMRQILINVVSNALKYSSEERIVNIMLDYTESDVILKVRDEGIGIPEADLPHLFEPFHRAANVGTISGTGLGLVITKEAVELHGGVITVESQLNVGTLFTIQLPIVTEAVNDDPAGDSAEGV